MHSYAMYESLLGKPYDDGDADCYGLARLFYRNNYGIDLPNYARSSGFLDEGLDLIGRFLSEQEFRVIDVAADKLELGDGLILCVPAPHKRERLPNHIAVFVGNGTFIHHLYGKKSEEDYLTPQWEARIMAVLRHPEVTASNAARLVKASRTLQELVQDHGNRRTS